MSLFSTPFRLASFQLAVTVLLAIVPFMSATVTPSPSRPDIQQRHELTQGWFPLGCWMNDPSLPALTSFWHRFSDNMTVEECTGFCSNANKSYAGLEIGLDCHCGDILTNGSTSAPASDCNATCIGNSAEICGGSDRLSIYWNGANPVQPTIVQSVNDWRFQGCYSDTNTARALTVEVPQNNTSVESCTEACHAGGYSLAGLEFAQQCFCDNSIQNGGLLIEVGSCPLACYGNTTEICGGVNSLVVYNFTGN